MTTLSNSEQNVVSDMAKAVAKMLDSDKKNLVSTNDELSDAEGFFMWVKDGAPGLHVQLNGAGKVPHVTGGNASASQEEMWAAYRRWQERKIIAHAAAPPPKRRPILEWTADILMWRGTWAFIAAVVVIIGAVYAASYGIRQASLSEEVRSAQVNEYGFRRADLLTKDWTYPSDCRKSGEGYEWTRTLESCRSNLERWEREGTVWVTWKDRGGKS